MTYDNKYDVIAAGGGFAGCAAACAAARQGQNVLLIESSGFLGGAASNCIVFPFMDYYTDVQDENGNNVRHYLTRGILAEIVTKLKNIDAIRGDDEFLNEALKQILDEMVTSAGVTVLFHSVICAVNKEHSRIKFVSAVTKAGVLDFEAKIFIDCTGDADICYMAGIPVRLGRENDSLCQPMTLCFRVGNVDKKAFFDNQKEMQRLYKEWFKAGKFTNPREDILVMDYPIDGVLHFNTTRIVKLDPTDPFDLTKAEIEGRRQVKELLDFFKANNIAGMENAKLIFTAPSIGVRESRMLDGQYLLTGDDLIKCTKFEDSIAAGNYDIDIHNPEGTGTSHYFFPRGTWYTIPYRALIPKACDAENLIVAGRCISATHEAQASIRIMPICASTGEAAGVAAAVANNSGSSVQNADINQIQRILTQTGAYIGL